MACGSFVLPKHDVIPDLNSNYILVPETKMDLSDITEFLLVIHRTGMPWGLQPTPSFFPFLFTRSRVTSAPPPQITNFLFHDATSKFGRFSALPIVRPRLPFWLLYWSRVGTKDISWCFFARLNLCKNNYHCWNWAFRETTLIFMSGSQNGH